MHYRVQLHCFRLVLYGEKPFIFLESFLLTEAAGLDAVRTSAVSEVSDKSVIGLARAM